MNLSDVYAAIDAEGIWTPAPNATAYGITTELNETIIRRRVAEGLNHLRSRMAGYLCGFNFNPELEEENIVMVFEFRHPQREGLDELLRAGIVDALAHYVLMCFYGTDDSLHAVGWRRACARLMLLLCGGGVNR